MDVLLAVVTSIIVVADKVTDKNKAKVDSICNILQEKLQHRADKKIFFEERYKSRNGMGE